MEFFSRKATGAEDESPDALDWESLGDYSIAPGTIAHATGLREMGDKSRKVGSLLIGLAGRLENVADDDQRARQKINGWSARHPSHYTLIPARDEYRPGESNYRHLPETFERRSDIDLEKLRGVRLSTTQE